MHNLHFFLLEKSTKLFVCLRQHDENAEKNFHLTPLTPPLTILSRHFLQLFYVDENNNNKKYFNSNQNHWKKLANQLTANGGNDKMSTGCNYRCEN